MGRLRADDMRALRTVAGVAALAAFVVGWWSVLFVGHGERFLLDPGLYFYPVYDATWARILAEKRMPLWNPYHLCGLPWLGTLQGGFFYPFHVAYAVWPIPFAAKMLGATHLAIMAVATAGFVRRLGLGVPAALLAAVVFALRGRGAGALGAPNMLEAITWLPVGAIAIADLVRAPSRRAVALLAGALGMSWLAGYPQPTVYILYLWGSLALALLVQAGVPLVEWPRRLAVMTAGILLGTGLAAVQLVPAMELARLGSRATTELAEQVMLPYGTLPPALPILLWESITGTSQAFGVVVLGLAAAALAARGRRVIAWWALGMGLLAAAWALGTHTLFFHLYRALPFVGWFREPARILFVFDFCFAIAAAVGLSALLESGNGVRDRSRGAWVAAFAALAGLGLAAAGIQTGYARPGVGPLGLAFGGIAAALVVASRLVRGSWRRWLVVALVVAATVEIGRNPWVGFRLAYEDGDLGTNEGLDRDRDRMAARVGHDRVWQPRPGPFPLFALKKLVRHRVRSLFDYEPVNLQRQAAYFTYFGEASTTPVAWPWIFGGMVEVTATEGTPPAATRRRLLDLAAVRWVAVLPHAAKSADLMQFVRDAGLALRPSIPPFRFYENRAALPRAFVTYHVRHAPSSDEAYLAALSHPGFDPFAESYVEAPVPGLGADPAPRGHPATFARDDEEVVELDVRLERPGLVVLSDTFYPGWHATVDGVPAPIVRTNFLFRGVPAPAGAHRVRFVYAPASVRAGTALSVTALGLTAWLLLSCRRRPAA